MRVRKGKCDYRLPPFGLIDSVLFSFDRQYHMALHRVTPEQFQSTQEVDGLPVMFTIMHDKIWIAPTPDRNGKLTVRYFPPMQEA